MPTFKLKAKPKEASKAIIVSFDSRWHDLIRDGKVGVVFRKKCPAKYLPKYMYAYMASPISAIASRIPILRIERLGIKEALQYAQEGAISEGELGKYCSSTDELFAIWTGSPAIARSPVTMQYLMMEYEFWPTPNFIALSDEGCCVIDSLGHFEEGTSR